jgi:hypothetical protein
MGGVLLTCLLCNAQDWKCVCAAAVWSTLTSQTDFLAHGVPGQKWPERESKSIRPPGADVCNYKRYLYNSLTSSSIGTWTRGQIYQGVVLGKKYIS